MRYFDGVSQDVERMDKEFKEMSRRNTSKSEEIKQSLDSKFSDFEKIKEKNKKKFNLIS